MKSVILTKISKSSHMPVAKQINELKGNGDMNFLKEFVKHCHKKADITPEGENSLLVCTKRGYYRYTCYPNYIKQINRANDAVAYFKIS